MDPVLHLCQAGLDVLAVAEGAALPPQQQLVEELHVHKAEQLLEELADEEGGDEGSLQRLQQGVKHAEDGPPMWAQHRPWMAAAHTCTTHNNVAGTCHSSMTIVMGMNLAGQLSCIAMLQTGSANTLRIVRQWGLSIAPGWLLPIPVPPTMMLLAPPLSL